MSQGRTTDKIALFHLVRNNNDISWFERFTRSYLRYAAGVEHQLVIIFKGFDDQQQLQEYQPYLEKLSYLSFQVTDDGFDITAYIKASQHFANQYPYFCFLNSHAEILCDNWLKHLYDNIQQPQVGIVGASASNQSHKGSCNGLTIGLSAFKYCIQRMRSNQSVGTKWNEVKDVVSHLYFLQQFDRFPNAHIRTNGFMIASDVMLKSCHNRILTKNDAYLFESGKQGLSRLVKKQGLKLVLVSRDGTAYEESEWGASGTFMQGTQDGLLIADNMTRKYAAADAKRKNRLFELAWTEQALYTCEKAWRRITNQRKFDEKLTLQKAKLDNIQLSNAKLLIFGVGELGQYYRELIKRQYNHMHIVGFVDSYVEGEQSGLSIYTPQALTRDEVEYDYVLISSNEYYQEILTTLLDLKIPSRVII